MYVHKCDGDWFEQHHAVIDYLLNTGSNRKCAPNAT